MYCVIIFNTGLVIDMIN